MNNKRFRLLVDASIDYAIFMLDANGYVTSWNAGAERIKGYRSDEILGHHFSKFYPSEAIERGWPNEELSRASRDGHFEDEGWRIRKDGTPFWANVVITPLKLKSGLVSGFAKVTRDLTERKAREDRLLELQAQLESQYKATQAALDSVRDLAQRLENVREEERLKIAVQLHDGIAQDLFAVKLSIDYLRVEAAAGKSILPTASELDATIDRCMKEIRNIADSLHPTALTHFSVAHALRQHAQYMTRLTGLSIKIKEESDFPELDETTRTLFFRAAQEALTNVARHAHATRVEMRLRADVNHASLSIKDNGIGICAGDLMKPRSLGLVGIRERFVSQGGSLAIESNEHCKGTTLTVALPRLSTRSLASA